MAGVALSIPLGGTSQTTAEGARIALGLGPNSDVTFHSLHLTGNLIVDGTITGTITLPADLTAIEALTGTGYAARTAANTWALRTLTGTASRVTVTNGDGTVGNPVFDISASYVGQSSITTLGTITTGVWTGTSIAILNGGTGATTAINARTNLGLTIGTDVQAFDADLAALAANSTDGLWAHTGAGTGAARTLTAPAAGFTITNPAGIAGNPTFVLSNDLLGVEGLAANGMVARTATDTWTVRTLAGTANEITATNGDGIAGAPTFSLPSSLTFTGKTITGGAFTGGTWNNGIIGGSTPLAGTFTTLTATDQIIISGAGAGQIVFPATQNASANANTLDDYVERTWTPTIVGGTTAGTGTYSVQLGSYTKIGNRVFFEMQLVWSAHTGTGAMRFSGLPFTSANIQFYPCAFGYSNFTYTVQAYGGVEPNTTYVQLYGGASNAAASVFTIEAAASVWLSGHYRV